MEISKPRRQGGLAERRDVFSEWIVCKSNKRCPCFCRNFSADHFLVPMPVSGGSLSVNESHRSHPKGCSTTLVN